MKLIILFLLCFAINISALEISNIQENSIEISLDSNEIKNKPLIIVFAVKDTTDIASIKLTLPKHNISNLVEATNINDLKPINNYYIIGKTSKPNHFRIKGIDPYTSFTVYAFEANSKEYKFVSRFSSTTKASEPKESATGIIFKNTDTDNIQITWQDASNSDGTLLLMSKDKPVTLPKDFKNYKPSKDFGNSASLVGNSTYAIFKGEKQYADFIKIDNLKFGTYHFQAFSYNGDYEGINYNTKSAKNNPRSVLTKLKPPIVDEDAEFFDDYFEITWNKVEGAVSYELQVAYDREFNAIVNNYNVVDVGNILTYGIFMEYPDKEYFVRLRAINGRNKSEWSKINEFED